MVLPKSNMDVKKFSSHRKSTRNGVYSVNWFTLIEASTSTIKTLPWLSGDRRKTQMNLDLQGQSTKLSLETTIFAEVRTTKSSSPKLQCLWRDKNLITSFSWKLQLLRMNTKPKKKKKELDWAELAHGSCVRGLMFSLQKPLIIRLCRERTAFW